MTWVNNYLIIVEEKKEDEKKEDKEGETKKEIKEETGEKTEDKKDEKVNIVKIKSVVTAHAHSVSSVNVL